MFKHECDVAYINLQVYQSSEPAISEQLVVNIFLLIIHSKLNKNTNIYLKRGKIMTKVYFKAFI